MADDRPQSTWPSAGLDLDKEEGSQRQGNDEAQSRVTGGVPIARSAFSRSSSRGKFPPDRSRMACTPCSAHAGPCVASTDQHVPQRNAPRVARINANPGAVPRGLQVCCKQTYPRPPACSQGGSRLEREVLDSLKLMLAGCVGRLSQLVRDRSRMSRRPLTDNKPQWINRIRFSSEHEP